MQIRVWLRNAVAQLPDSDSPKRDAEILLGKVLGKSRAWLIAFDDATLDDAQLAQLDALLVRRAAGEPVAYLTGEREFWSLSLTVSPDTLIPRPDSEVLVEQALARLPAEPCKVLDLGTGTGAIALALASERPDCQVTGVDRIAAAVALAQHNASKLALANTGFLQSHWFSALEGQQFALIVSNPPTLMPMTTIFHRATCVLNPPVRWWQAIMAWPISESLPQKQGAIYRIMAGYYWNTAGSRAKTSGKFCAKTASTQWKPVRIMAAMTA
ncbi:hypothetical protein ERHA54_21600 [Erwinia rhapontici]|nr:hypothetical protein ERHA54_21600 [Erwinia rhapontici]